LLGLGFYGGGVMMEGGLAKGKTREYATQGLGREM